MIMLDMGRDNDVWVHEEEAFGSGYERGLALGGVSEASVGYLCTARYQLRWDLGR
jgi:hypothetical protein